MKIILILILFLTSSCLNKSNYVEVPQKPKGIPENSFWKGGADGGNWYVIKSIIVIEIAPKYRSTTIRTVV
ncbi:MAG TPA: hypothetical protein VK616_20345 [Flavitalea sp.]|nr:hypothetical protein [Flavitalea sp.]